MSLRPTSTRCLLAVLCLAAAACGQDPDVEAAVKAQAEDTRRDDFIAQSWSRTDTMAARAEEVRRHAEQDETGVRPELVEALEAFEERMEIARLRAEALSEAGDDWVEERAAWSVAWREVEDAWDAVASYAH